MAAVADRLGYWWVTERSSVLVRLFLTVAGCGRENCLVVRMRKGRSGAQVYLAAVLEYLAAEVQELAGMEMLPWITTRRPRSFLGGCWREGDADTCVMGVLTATLRGFVLSSTIEGEGQCSKPTIEIGVQYVACSKDVAALVALAMVVYLSMNGCKLLLTSSGGR